MLEKLQGILKSSVNFPSPPAIAQQIIALAADPDIDLVRVATTISKDPGLTAKVLRVANSPLYSKRRKSDNLRQALVVLGLNAATTLALSFSLVGTYRNIKGAGVDYLRFWRKTILSASAARAFAEQQRVAAAEDIFLAALLQDLAILAVDRVMPDFYQGLPKDCAHTDLCAYEKSRLGIDHAGLGSWLLGQWRLPETLCHSVEWSHAPSACEAGTRAGIAAACVALGGECVEMLLATQAPTDIGELAQHAEQWLGLDAESLAATMSTIVAEIPEIERLFDTALLPAETAAVMLEQARELLLIRNLQALEQVTTLQAATADLEARTSALEDQHRRDPLTGLFNRGHLDHVLREEFEAANTGGWPLSIVFIDLDRFKAVNDTYGHPAGDHVLVGTAQRIMTVARATDCVARYGGEEFVIVLPGLDSANAETVCRRLIVRLRKTQFAVQDATITVTASLGLATHQPDKPFAGVAQLLEAADRSVYAAKRSGRDRLVRHDPDHRGAHPGHATGGGLPRYSSP
ncbi:MAG: GGDEF domain-containing protein [Gammaproteobacteria bacterium]|nr:GGDEF domain-containing protein [Gammaproteobacteria bacterium]